MQIHKCSVLLELFKILSLGIEVGGETPYSIQRTLGVRPVKT